MLTLDANKAALAVARFTSLTGLTQDNAQRLVEDAAQAVVDQCLDAVVGRGPVASTLGAVRAKQLHGVCLKFGRTLSRNEVGVLFRITPSTAQSVITTMNATYAESFHSQLEERMKARATCCAGCHHHRSVH
jgi:ABC-type amino acid transport substrate-binding protein